MDVEQPDKPHSSTVAFLFKSNKMIFFWKRFYLFIFRKRRRERGREGEKHWCVRETSIGCLLQAPTENLAWDSTHWATPARANEIIFKMPSSSDILCFSVFGEGLAGRGCMQTEVRNALAGCAWKLCTTEQGWATTAVQRLTNFGI